MTDFAPAFATSLDPNIFADFPPVSIKLRDSPRHPSNQKSCRSLPFNILGEAETMVNDLVKSGVIKECTEPTEFCAASNFIRKQTGRGVRMVTDLRPLNSHAEGVGWPF